MVTEGLKKAAVFGFGAAVGVAGAVLAKKLLAKAVQGGSVYRTSQFLPPSAAETLLVID